MKNKQQRTNKNTPKQQQGKNTNTTKQTNKI